MAVDLLVDLCSHLVLHSGELRMSEHFLTIPGSSCRSSVNTQTLATGHQRTASYTRSDQMRDISSLS